MASVDVQQYFRLGLDTTDQPLAGTGVINIVRKAPDTVSNQHNQVIFRLDNEGLLTKDSGITLRPELSSAATASNVSLNVINGILGSIKRATLRIDGQTLTDVVEPALLENQRLYSRNSTARLLDFHQAFLGNQFAVEVDEDPIVGDDETAPNADAGLERFRTTQALQYKPDASDSRVQRAKIVTGSNKTYFIPLSMLGMNFLRYSSLPMYLLQDRQVELVIEFESDARKWAFDENAGIAASDASIDLDSCELTQVRIQLDEDIIAEQREIMRAEGGVDYALMETYTVKHVITSGDTLDTEKEFSVIRVNAQNREVQKVLVAYTDTADVFANRYGGLGRNPMAAQISNCLGDVRYNWRINGAYLFDKDIDSSAVQYYLNAEYNGSFGLKISNSAWAMDKAVEHQTTGADEPDQLFYQGRMFYTGQSLRNGNAGVQGGGTGIRVPMEFHLAATPRVDGSKGDGVFGIDQTDEEIVLNIYVTNTKLLKLLPSSVMMSF
jgi:hypothetical protein